jgi:hypothetical protein
MRISRNVVAGLSAVALLLAPVAQAATFNPEHILDDATLRRSSSMSYDDIRTFLEKKGGLANVRDIDPVDGKRKNGAQIVADAAARYNVNPQYILALIQKESSAVETDAPAKRQLEWATGYALCDGCARNNSLAKKYRGFAKQVDAGAGWIDWYFQHASTSGSLHRPGVTYAVSDMQITPENLATAALYSYTPHMHGNLLLWNIWNRWFGDGSSSMEFPDGTLARDAKTGAVALVQGGKFRPIVSPAVLTSRFSGIVPVDIDHDVFSGFLQQKQGRAVRFSDFSLVRVEDGGIYLLVGNTKRRIVSMDAFAKIGFNPEEVEDAHAAELADYADGDPITVDTESAAGELLQDAQTGGIYYVVDRVRHSLYDRALLIVNFSDEPIGRASHEELSAMTEGAPVRFDDGVLVKAPGDPAVYVISAVKKRPIPSEDIFLAFGYRWSNVVTTTKKMLDLHPLGDPLSIAVSPSAPVSP